MNERLKARLEDNLREMEELLGEMDGHFAAHERAAAEAREGLGEAETEEDRR